MHQLGTKPVLWDREGVQAGGDTCIPVADSRRDIQQNQSQYSKYYLQWR